MRTGRRHGMVRVHHYFLAAALAVAGCGPSLPGTCRGDDECPGGACVAGRCRALEGADLAGADGGPNQPADLSTPNGSTDGHGAADLALSDDGAAPMCAFNNDGKIERKEEPFLVGLGGTFAVNTPGTTVPVTVAPQGGGWDFSAPVANDGNPVVDKLLPPGGKWWAADFPTATYAERIDDGQALYGVFHVTDASLELLGVVSELGGLQKTELTYAKPIPVLQFPLSMGSQWIAESDVTGFASGFVVSAHDKYVFLVDASGKTKVPVGTFDTLRLRMNYTQSVGGFPTTTRVQYLHLAECFGAVARIRSKDNEPSNDFTEAAEYRRLAQ